MAQSQEFPSVNVTSRYNDFEALLANSRNERILFSARYGAGKTYFLQKYFAERSDSCVVTRLFPVNYSISSNEDIFRIIKFDIIYELITTLNLPLTAYPIDSKIANEFAIINTVNFALSSLTKSLLSIIPLLNKSDIDLDKASAVIGEVIGKGQEFYMQSQEAIKGLSHLQPLMNFIKESSENYLFEDDFITNFIIESLDKLSEGKRKKILIVDDIDRIDPEHIFRLFNIFSAHFDNRKDAGNKFGFDHVIFVCDVDNIRHIFAARYGIKTDYTGYLNKFYSTEPYRFDNNKMLADSLKVILETINFGNDRNYKEFVENSFFHGEISVLSIMNEMAHSGALSIRRLIGVSNRSIPFAERRTVFRYSNDNGWIVNYKMPIVAILELLLWLFGSIDELRRALEVVAAYDITSEANYRRANSSTRNYPSQIALLSWSMPVADRLQFFKEVRNKPKDKSAENMTFMSNTTKYTYVYLPQVSDSPYDFACSAKVQTLNGSDINFLRATDSLGAFDVLLGAFEELVKVNYLV